MTARLYIPAHLHMLDGQISTARSEGAHILAAQIERTAARYRERLARGETWLELTPIKCADIGARNQKTGKRGY